MTGAAVTYGGSLYELAVEEGLSAQFLEELRGIETLFSDEPTYLKLLSEPGVPRKERCALIEEAFAGQVHDYIKSFLKILCENNILSDFGGCLREFTRRYNEANGIITATATSAVALTAQQSESLREKLCRMTGRTVELTTKVDPACLGGMRLDIDGKRLDSTVSERLESIRALLSQSRVSDGTTSD